MPKKRRTCQKGFTLVELIVTLAVLGVIVVPIGTMFVANTVQYYRENKKIAASSDSLIACTKLFDHFRQAEQESITLSEGGSRADFQIQASSYQAVYDSAEGTLLLLQGGTKQVLLKQVESALFSLPEPGRISLTLTTRTPLPFQEDYLYTRTYDYTKRTK